MFLRIDDNNIVREKIGTPYDRNMRPRFHPDLMALIVWVPAGGEEGDVFDPATGTCYKPPVVVPSPEDRDDARKAAIRADYLEALLTRNVAVARQLETEYIALLQTAPAVPGIEGKD